MKNKISTKLPFTQNALFVLEKRYLKRDASGKVTESPEEMFWRVAKVVAAVDALYDKGANLEEIAQRFYEIMAKLDFLPNSPTLMNAGRALGQLSACFVLPVKDSIEGIFDSLKHAALIHKSGGGTGFSFSRIRPQGDLVKTTYGVASGPVSFMRIYDVATETIKQGGMRRGANMGILSVHHPDIEQFIESKANNQLFRNFNISVAITNNFMEALKKDGDYKLINPRTNQVVKRLSAHYIFDKIAEAAWRSGDPGVIFIDTINAANPTPTLGKIEATNPCGEQPLLPYESCNLGSINLSHFVENSGINYKRLGEVVDTAVHFLDNVIDANKYPLPQIEKITKANRKIGLGVMGFADMLIKLGIPYDSERAEKIAAEVMDFINKRSKEASIKLAEKRGSFPNFEKSIYPEKGFKYLRNATTTTIAPTGSLSIIAGCSSGIEPLFALAYERHILNGNILQEIHPLFLEVVKKEDFYGEDFLKAISRVGSIKMLQGYQIPETLKRLFVTAHDIDYEWHLRIQAAFQKHTDNAVSKTINLPQTATVEDIKKIYLMAYKLGLKGVTIYRDKSKPEQVLMVPSKEGKRKIAPRPRPKITHGITERVMTGCGKLYVTVNFDEHGICEVFAHMGKTGGCAASQIEATCRLISLALRSGVKVEAIVRQLRGIRCPRPTWSEGKQVLSCADAIAQVLAEIGRVQAEPVEIGVLACPECGDVLIHEGGCVTCRTCGFSRCD